MPRTSKKLFLDTYSLKIINYIVTSPQLEKKGVENGIHLIGKDKSKISGLEKISAEQIVFVIYPDREIIDVVGELLFKLNTFNKKLNFNIIFTSGETYEIVEYMTTCDLINYFSIYSFQTDLIPFDYDLLSLEHSNSLKDIYLLDKYDCITNLAKAIAKLEIIYGKIANKFIKGDTANILNELLVREEKINAIEPTKGTPEIFGCIMLDRSIDMITPFCSHYTYEGLLDEYFGINYNRIKVKESIINDKQKDKDKEKTIEVGSRVVFYSKIRNMPFGMTNTFLKQTLTHYQETGDKTKKLSEKSETKVMVETLKKYKQLIKEEEGPMIEHISLANYITHNQNNPGYLEYLKFEQLMLAGDLPENLHDYYEKEIGKQTNLYKILKLLCLESILQNGIEDYSKIKKDIMLTYGFQKIFLFNNLEKIGLLKDKNAPGKPLTLIQYQAIIKKLNLLNEDCDPNKIEDCSFVFGGYCSISLRLIEATIKNGWKDISDGLKKIPGYTYYPSNEKEILKQRKEKNFIFVVFIGGITYPEIEGIRFLNQINKDFKFIIVTTNIINSKKIFEGLESEVVPTLTMKEFYEMTLNDDPKKKKKK